MGGSHLSRSSNLSLLESANSQVGTLAWAHWSHTWVQKSLFCSKIFQGWVGQKTAWQLTNLRNFHCQFFFSFFFAHARGATGFCWPKRDVATHRPAPWIWDKVVYVNQNLDFAMETTDFKTLLGHVSQLTQWNIIWIWAEVSWPLAKAGTGIRRIQASTISSWSVWFWSQNSRTFWLFSSFFYHIFTERIHSFIDDRFDPRLLAFIQTHQGRSAPGMQRSPVSVSNILFNRHCDLGVRILSTCGL